MENPLHIPPGKRIKYLTIFCYLCKTNISDLCKQTGKPIQRCPYGDKHAFKVYVPVPGTANERKTKTLQTRDVNEAIKQAIDFEKEVKGNSIASIVPLKHKKEVLPERENTPRLLSHAMARYIGWLHNEGVPAHRVKERSDKHIQDVVRAFKVWAECMDISMLTINQINDQTVGYIHQYLLTAKGFSNRTYNKYLSYYTSFMTWYAEEYDIPMRNWFEKVQRKKLNPDPQAITQEEYEALLECMKPENALKHPDIKGTYARSYYRPWLADGIRLALETGRRREEVANLNFKDITDDGQGNAFIKVEDYKVNRIQNRQTEQEKKIVFVPITDSLRQLLIELDYEKYKGTDTFILAPEVQQGRTRVVCEVLTRGFTQYYEQLNTGRELTFKSLRKAYITSLSLYTGGNAKSITRHSDNAVIEKHYIDKKAVANAAKGFSVFSKESELEQLRNAKEKQLNMEVEK